MAITLIGKLGSNLETTEFYLQEPIPKRVGYLLEQFEKFKIITKNQKVDISNSMGKNQKSMYKSKYEFKKGK